MSGAIRRVTIRGRVQGVGYRAWVEHQAVAHGLEGWVRNRTRRQRRGAVCRAGRMSSLTWWRHAGVDRHRRASLPSRKNRRASMH